MLLRHRQRESSPALKPFGEVRGPVEVTPLSEFASSISNT